MSKELELTREKQQDGGRHDASADDSGQTCHANASGWLKGGLTMAICCAAPLLLVAAITFFGLSLGALANGALNVAAILACPLGMFLMMRMMTKEKK
jgi:hypothetical protein